MTRAYYNEIDPAAAAVLRELVLRDVIPLGDVDTRSIKEVTPDDIHGYTQCHFFAGGGLWPVAGRIAGWPDDRRWWTGSCPCQGESLAGKRLGADDPRHLWPDFYRLIRAERPPVIMGEQVAAAAGTHWLDGVCADLEVENYAARAVDIPACAVDAPHQRNRLYWAAMDNRVGAGLEGQRRHVIGTAEGRGFQGGFASAADDLLFADAEGRERRPGFRESGAKCHGALLADRHGDLQPDASGGGRDGRQEAPERSAEQRAAAKRASDNLRNGSWWADAQWIVSPLDGKARRTKPGIPFLVDGLPGRVDLWRIGGNAISPILAAEVVAAFLETDGLALTSQQGKSP